jgi:hypothetical protein
MSFEFRPARDSVLVLILGLTTLLTCSSARANVYATNVKLNGSFTNFTALFGQAVPISYLLNEPATLGATITITAGSGTVRTINLAAGNPGTLFGTNVVSWDGTDDQSHPVTPGSYSVSVTPAAAGFTNWTHISSDSNPNAFVYYGTGIAVDRNATSPYYGRILIANSLDGGSADTAAGILKFNADASAAEEGVLSTGQDGHDWQGSQLSPWSLAVSADDLVYADDRFNGGEVFRWDPTLSSNSLVAVLRTDNQPAGADLTGPAIIGTGTNTQIWMADSLSTSGILKWTVTNDMTCATNDMGQTVVALGGDLSVPPYTVALDQLGNIYTVQNITDEGNPLPRVLRFPAYDPSTNSFIAETNADWATGANDNNYGGASGVAVDPTGTYVAVAFQGTQFGGLVATNGSTRILYATNGAWVADLDLGISFDGDPSHQDTACAWDAVGNVYYIDNWSGHWRIASPPGTNQATTVALAQVRIQAPSIIEITNITVSSGGVTLLFTAGTNDSASDFTLLAASIADGTYTAASSATITPVSPGVFRATAPVSGAAAQFYRIRR